MDERALAMADEADLLRIESEVRKITNRLPKQPPGFNGECVDCNDQIPQERIQFGAVTCVYCQEIREKTRAQYSP